MKGYSGMSDTSALSEAKRALLERHLAGKRAPEIATTNAASEPPAIDTTGQRERVVMVQPGTYKRPFFYLSGDAPARTFYCYPLAHGLGEDQPFYILEPYDFSDLALPPTFEEMAAAHITRMRTIQPEGPYQLGGWCNGGLVAYEMARQLYAQGQTLELLVLMDADPPAKFQWDYRIIASAASLLRLNQKRQFAWFLQFRHLRLAFHFWRTHTFKLRRTTRSDEQEQSVIDAQSEQLNALIINNESSIRDWERIFDWMASGYIPRSSYPGKITFFWTREEPARQIKWRRWLTAKTQTGTVTVRIIPGNHITSRTEYLPLLAEQLRICLDEAHRNVSSKGGDAS